jgi:hypothetical protein
MLLFLDDCPFLSYFSALLDPSGGFGPVVSRGCLEDWSGHKNMAREQKIFSLLLGFCYLAPHCSLPWRNYSSSCKLSKLSSFLKMSRLCRVGSFTQDTS